MTEAEWLVCSDPSAMFGHIRDKISERKWKLYACACCRRLWPFLASEPARRIIETIERSVDGEATAEDVNRGWEEAEQLLDKEQDNLVEVYHTLQGLFTRSPVSAVFIADLAALDAGAILVWRKYFPREKPTITLRLPPTWTESMAAERKDAATREQEEQAKLLRDIFNPFLSSDLIDPACLSWNNGTVPKLAQQIYTDRAFENLPVLADALEDAACRDRTMISHCRGGLHVRGCWVIDRILSKDR